MRNRSLIPRVLCALLLLSFAATTLPRLVARAREALTLLPLPYESRRERQMGAWYSSVQALRKTLPRKEPVALVLGVRDTEAAIFASYYLYPIRTRLFAGRNDYRDAAPDLTRPKTIIGVTSEGVEKTSYEVLRDRDLRAGHRVVAPLGAYWIGWSPDARSVAFATVEGQEPATKISIVDVASGSLRSIDLVARATQVRWAPDGGSLAYVTQAGELWIVRSDGTNARRVATAVGDFDW